MYLKSTTFTALAAIGLASLAAADEPFVLGDAELDRMTAAGTVVFNTDVDKTVDIVKNVDLNVDKDVNSVVDLDGSLATAEASADAIDFDNVLAEVDVFSQVSFIGAFAFAESLSAGDNNGGGGNGGNGGNGGTPPVP